MPLLLFVALLFAADDPVLRVPYMPESKLVHRVDPEYPATAYERRIQGTVRLSVEIGKDGRIERTRLLSGHPLLAGAARRAVRQWVYEPSLLNGKPVRVVTSVPVHFVWSPPRPPANRI